MGRRARGKKQTGKSNGKISRTPPSSKKSEKSQDLSSTAATQPADNSSPDQGNNLLFWKRIGKIGALIGIIAAILTLGTIFDFYITIDNPNLSVECCKEGLNISPTLLFDRYLGFSFLDFLNLSVQLEAPKDLEDNPKFFIAFSPDRLPVHHHSSRVSISNREPLEFGKKYAILIKARSGPFNICTREENIYINSEKRFSDFTISADRKTIRVERGSSNNFLTIKINSSSGYDKLVSLEVKPETQGVDFLLNKSSGIPPFPSYIIINTTKDATIGNNTYMVYGVGNDTKFRVFEFNLDIIEKNNNPYELEINPSNPTLYPGSKKNLVLELRRYGDYQGVVKLSAVGVPNMFNVNFLPQSLQVSSSTPYPESLIILTANNSSEIGKYRMYVMGLDEKGFVASKAIDIEMKKGDFEIVLDPTEIEFISEENEKDVNVKIIPLNGYSGLIHLSSKYTPAYINVDINPREVKINSNDENSNFTAKMHIKQNINSNQKDKVILKADDENGLQHMAEINFDINKYNPAEFSTKLTFSSEGIQPVEGAMSDTMLDDDKYAKFIFSTREGSAVIAELDGTNSISNSSKLGLILDSKIFKVDSNPDSCWPQLTVKVFNRRSNSYDPIPKCSQICHTKSGNAFCPFPKNAKDYICDSGKIKVLYSIFDPDPRHPNVEFYLDYQSVCENNVTSS
jgi:hypothetical protein